MTKKRLPNVVQHAQTRLYLELPEGGAFVDLIAEHATKRTRVFRMNASRLLRLRALLALAQNELDALAPPTSEGPT